MPIQMCCWSVLIETFSRFAEWLETAAIAPSNKISFWTRLFGQKPNKPPFNKAQSKDLADKLRKSLSELRELLFSEDDVAIEVKQSSKSTEKNTNTTEAGLNIAPIKISDAEQAGTTA